MMYLQLGLLFFLLGFIVAEFAPDETKNMVSSKKNQNIAKNAFFLAMIHLQTIIFKNMVFLLYNPLVPNSWLHFGSICSQWNQKCGPHIVFCKKIHIFFSYAAFSYT